MGKIDANSQVEFSEDNIFDELASDINSKSKEAKDTKEREDKNLYDYLKIYSSIVMWLNILLFIFFLLFFLYNYIQKSEKELSYNIPHFLCKTLIRSFEGTSCDGVEYTLKKLKRDIATEKQKQTKMIIPLIGDLYSFENFRFSKKVAFLIDKSNNRLEPSIILSAFDTLKGKYASVDKSEVDCGNITIHEPNILRIDCDIYASDWDSEIFYFEDGVKKANTIGGGSMSKAANFIDYIENDDFSPFKVKTKTEQFTSESVQRAPYTQKTRIMLELEYFNTDLLLK